MSESVDQTIEELEEGFTELVSGFRAVIRVLREEIRMLRQESLTLHARLDEHRRIYPAPVPRLVEPGESWGAAPTSLIGAQVFVPAVPAAAMALTPKAPVEKPKKITPLTLKACEKCGAEQLMTKQRHFCQSCVNKAAQIRIQKWHLDKFAEKHAQP